MGGGNNGSAGVEGYNGNIDLSNRPVIHNQDGTVSTERSFSIGTDQGEVLLPQVVNGKILDRKDAIEHYRKTGEHLGVYPDVATANDVAERVHNRFTSVIKPETGAAKYWYVDPRASGVPSPDGGQQFNPAQYADEQGHDKPDPQSEELTKLQEALRRIGALPEGTQPSF